MDSSLAAMYALLLVSLDHNVPSIQAAQDLDELALSGMHRSKSGNIVVHYLIPR
jgi:hypothetical protein